jgi:hypothetical protein
VSEKFQERQRESLESIAIDRRLQLERNYVRNPERSHSELVYLGYWAIASQLRIDFQSGRLTES